MRHLIKGVPANDETAREALKDLPALFINDIGKLDIKTVLCAAERVAKSVDYKALAFVFIQAGMGEKPALKMSQNVLRALNRSSLETKLERELGKDPFDFKAVQEGVMEKYAPMGVLTHIAAGNAAGLPAMSVLEGLLTGNVNLLKLPGNDGGLSVWMLKKLIEEEPALAPYIYAFDIPSEDIAGIKKLIEASAAVTVWGSDAAVSGIRALTPPQIPVIEWGNRISFGYVTKKGETKEGLEALAEDICSTEQLLCSAPQCIYYETEDKNELYAFAGRFASAMKEVSPRYAPTLADIHFQAEITSVVELAKMEEVLDEKKVLQDENGVWCLLAELKSSLKASPMYRNSWIKPIKRSLVNSLFYPYRGYLQTAGLCCGEEEEKELAGILIASGVNRIKPPGKMSDEYPGEPHDGRFTLQQYVRKVTIQK